MVTQDPDNAYLLDDMQSFLAANFSVLQPGTNLFAVEQPPEPDFCVTVYQYAGKPPVYTFGNRVYSELPRLHIRVRDTNPRVAQDFLYRIWKLFAETTSAVINGTYYVAMGPSGSISQPGGADNQDRVEMACNFEVEREI